MMQDGLRPHVDPNELQGGLGVVAEQTELSIEVTKIAPNGLGYGEGSISYAESIKHVSPEDVQKAEAVITSPQILVDVSVDSEGDPIQDDGCGDGREAGIILFGTTEVNKPSLNRAKVFGGGATMALAARIGVSGIQADTLNGEFSTVMDELDDRLIGYGAHTDDHAHGESCGCGAIDKAPTIIANAVKFQSEITGSIAALEIPTDGLSDVFERFKNVNERISGQYYSGKEVSDGIKGHDKVTKVLRGAHEEEFIVLNLVPGKTVDQRAVRQATDDQVQAFATDVWRLKEIAEKMYPDGQQEQVSAFLGELVYTLATAATLTDGTLPVYVVGQKQ